jgi:O-antigen ligase
MRSSASIYRQPNTLLDTSFPVLLVFIFFIYSAVMEVVHVLGVLRPQLILATLGLLAVFGTGQFMKVITSRIGLCVVAFTLWFLACVPFGAWPGGSFHVFIDQWYKAALIFILTAGLLTTLPQAKRIFHAIAYATGILGFLVLLKNERTSDGRLVLFDTRYSNANDLAWTLLIGLTFVGFLFLRGSRVQKAIGLMIVPPMLLTISRTGSRAGALGVVLLFFLTLFQAKRTTRNRLLAVSPIIALAVIMLLPKETLVRYTTYFGNYDPYNLSTMEKMRMGTIESTEARKQLLIDSLVMSARHPFLGVGPGNFDVVQNEMAIARGAIKGMWHVTHNTYTQLSSEMGLPGLAIYLAMIYYVFKTLSGIRRTKTTSPAWNDLRDLALCLRTAFILFLPIAFFDSLAYDADIPILAGLTTALGFMAQKQRAIDRANATEEKVSALTVADTTLEPATVGQY